MERLSEDKIKENGEEMRNRINAINSSVADSELWLIINKNGQNY